MLQKLYSRIIVLCLVAAFGFSSQLIPVSGDASPVLTGDTSALTVSLDSFSQSLVNGNSHQLVGVYADYSFAFPIVQQPTSNPGFVSLEDGKVTQFSQASQYGSIGLIAHNNLAGADFSLAAVGDIITLVYGDGKTATYSVTEVKQYQAFSPSNPYSNFIDLADPATVLDVVTVFKSIYAAKGRLVMQTCIAKDGVDSWGRLFVIAEPIDLTPVGYQFIFPSDVTQ